MDDTCTISFDAFTKQQWADADIKNGNQIWDKFTMLCLSRLFEQKKEEEEEDNSW